MDREDSVVASRSARPQPGTTGNAQPSPALPAPRLQLRWLVNDGERQFNWRPEDTEWKCEYELVLPLQEYDVRREIYDEDGEQVGERSELVVALKGATIRGGGTEPCWDRHAFKWYADTPFRDGVHASLDAAVLGGLPVYVIAVDGRAILVEEPTEDGSQSAGEPRGDAQRRATPNLTPGEGE